MFILTAEDSNTQKSIGGQNTPDVIVIEEKSTDAKRNGAENEVSEEDSDDDVQVHV